MRRSKIIFQESDRIRNPTRLLIVERTSNSRILERIIRAKEKRNRLKKFNKADQIVVRRITWRKHSQICDDSQLLQC